MGDLIWSIAHLLAASFFAQRAAHLFLTGRYRAAAALVPMSLAFVLWSAMKAWPHLGAP